MKKLRSLIRNLSMANDDDKEINETNDNCDSNRPADDDENSSFLGRKLRKTFSSIRCKLRRRKTSDNQLDSVNQTTFFVAKEQSGSKSRRVRRSKSLVRPIERSSYTGSTSSATHYEEVEDGSSSFSREIRRPSAVFSPSIPLVRSSKSIGEELRSLARYGWYWGPISRTETQNRLSSTPDGSFLIRDSCSDYHLLTLSYRCNGQTFHTRTAFVGGFYSLFPSSEASDLFPSVVELFKHAVDKSARGVLCYVNHGREMMAVRLLNPISRFDHVRSLQSMCRFVVRQNIRWDYIDKLPLPPPLKVYLEQNHFL